MVIVMKLFFKRLSKYKPLLKFIFVFFLFYFSGLFQIIPIILFKLKNYGDATDVALSLFSNLFLILILIKLYKDELKTEWNNFRNNIATNIDIGVKGWFLGLLGMMFFNIVLTMFLRDGGAANEQEVQKMISALPWVMFVNAGIIGPFIEEIVFRKTLKNIFKSGTSFIIISGLMFGLMHVASSFTTIGSILYFIPYSCLGWAFGYMYQKTDSVFTSTLLHILHNSTLILCSILM